MKKYIAIIIAILLILILSFPNKKSEKYVIKSKMIKSYEIISKQIENNEKINTINDGEIIDYSKIISNNDKIIGKGQFIKLESNIVYGFLNYNGYCLKKEYNDKLNFIKGYCEDIDLPEIGYQKIEKNNNSMLKEDVYTTKKNDFNSRKYFVGDNPNNYIIYSNSCWRIVNIANNNSLKIVYEGQAENNQCTDVTTNISGSIGLFTWDINKNKVGNWEEQSYLRERMEYWAKNNIIDVKPLKIKLERNYIVDAYWNIGPINTKNINISEDINDEENIITKRRYSLGLLNASDYLKISCKTSSNLSTGACGKSNYLYKSKYNWWTINSVNNNQKNVWIIMQDGMIKNIPVKLSNEYFFSGTRIVTYLKDDIVIIGDGTQMSPYMIVR